jgi:hypothetical protein
MSANNSINWNSLGDEIRTIYRTVHLRKTNKKPQQRLIEVKIFFDKLIDDVYKKHKLHIDAFIEKRKPIDEKLRIIEEGLKVKIEDMLGIKPISASSFSAGTNLLDESDLDFNIPIPDFTIPKLGVFYTILQANGYKFVKIVSADNPGIHFVFQGFVEGVEIEIKLRDAAYYMEVHHKMHDYLDNTMPKEHKATIAWIKSNLKPNKDVYALFKALYYEQGLANAKVYEMLYPLIEGGGKKKNGRRTKRR